MDNAGYTYYGEGSFFHAHADKIMGTRFDMICSGLSDTDSHLLWDEVVSLLKNGDEIFDKFCPESELSEVNESLRTKGYAELGPELCSEVNRCFDYYDSTFGLFDISRGHFSALSLDGSTLKVKGEEVDLDFGGYAKGWALKKVVEIIRDRGAKSAFVDFGGSSIYAYGDHPSGEGWLVDLPSPFDGHVVTMYSLRDEALSTSGNTPWYTGHIVNPISGQRETSRTLATVRCPDPLLAEVLSTVYMICDSSQRTEIEDRFPDVKFEKFNLDILD